MSSRLLDWPELKSRVPYSRMHIGRLERRGEFPQRVKVGPGRVAWIESEVEEWIQSRERGAAQFVNGRSK